MGVECSYSLAPALVHIGTRYSETLSLRYETGASQYAVGGVNVRILQILSHKSNAQLAAQMLAKPSISEKFR